MRRGAKPVKARVEAKPAVAGKPPKNDGSRVRDLEKRLAEALEQQTATAEILKVISRSPMDLQPVLDAVALNASRLCGAANVSLYRVEGPLMRKVAEQGQPLTALRVGETRPIARTSVSGRAILDRTTIHLPDHQSAEAAREYPDARRDTGIRTTIGIPLLREGGAIGAFTAYRTESRPFSEREIALLQTFADQAAIAIENVRLFNETKEALEQQTATAGILRVISSSPTDLQPVLDAVAESAARVCGAADSHIQLLEGNVLRTVAIHGDLPLSVAVGDPISATPATIAGRAVCERRTIHIDDLEALPETEYPETRARLRRAGARSRTSLVVPLLREGMPLGSIVIRRGVVQPFSDKQIALLETFAAQAVIAIENVRLFQELGARNRELTEALERERATGEVLGVIGASPTSVEPVFETILASAMRLCDTPVGLLFLYENGAFRLVADRGAPAAFTERIRTPYQPSSRGIGLARAVADRRPVQVLDTLADPAYAEGTRARLATVELLGARTAVWVPMLREGEPVGVICTWRPEVRAFTDAQIHLLSTFAAQAVIALENARLFETLASRNQELTEALEQQTATAEILRVISRSPTDVQPVLDTVAENAARVCGADDAIIARLDGDVLRTVAGVGQLQRLPPDEGWPVRGSVSGRAVIERRTVHTHDMQTVSDAEFPYSMARVRALGLRTVLATPLLREGVPIGLIVIRRVEVRPFSDKQIELLETFAAQAVIAIENVRLFQELEARNRDLTEALDQQTATAEILQAISGSQTDTQPVFDAIVQSAVRLCDGFFSTLYSFDGERLHLRAAHNVPPATRAILLDRAFETPIRFRSSMTGRAVLERRVVHIRDTQADPEVPEGLRHVTASMGARSWVAVPMLREGDAIGAITVSRRQVKPFTEGEIGLLQTFASQAVIAIENVRLFRELRGRTEQLTRSVEQLTALGEVGRAVSSTLDLETVLTTIVSQASQLAGADGCSIHEYDETTQRFQLRATHNYDAELVEIVRAMPLRMGEGVMGGAAERRAPIQVPDIAREGAYQSRYRDVLLRIGYRAVLAVPLMREDQVIGALTVSRKVPGEFAPDVVELLKTFATQSALAIQNARLFREIADKSRQLEAASRHKSEFLANMSHELRTPLNAILGFNEMILGEVYGEVPADLKEPLTDIQNSGKHLLRLINNVLDLSKIEAGRMELAPADYAVQDIVEKVRASLHPLAADKGLEFVASVPEDLPVAHGDPGRITQCLMNLAGNALKFTRRGRVEISASLQGDLLVYRVADTGIGIATDRIETVFAEFRQGDATITSEFGGTGLGLSITRKFVEMHRGRIWVESEPGKGSTFSFAIPLRLAGGQPA